MNVAFFDVDGTLLPHPSLEKRFFWSLLLARRIRAANCLVWAAQLAGLRRPEDSGARCDSKIYLRGVSAILPEPGQVRWLPEFFPAAIECVWWHALRGDEIALATGTLAPLADLVRAGLERELLWRGVGTKIAVIATRLATRDGCWTGKVDGVPIVGEAKAAAAREFAGSRGVALSRCFAYGDQTEDGAMLRSVGNPAAVNPVPCLRREALRRGWQVLDWSPCPRRTAGTRRALNWKGEAAR